MRRVSSTLAILLLLRTLAAAGDCKGTLYLTIDTGTMKPAEEIAAILRKQHVKATFFIANEKTPRGDYTLDEAYAPFWQGLVKDGHAFGSHTWRHWYFRSDSMGGKVNYIPLSGKAEIMGKQEVCQELNQVRDAFLKMTGSKLDPIWRAPGGRHTPRTLELARACGYEHVGWSDAGFLGDELPSAKFPNTLLLKRALANLIDGDVMVMHLGIRSRQDPFWPMLDPLLSGLKKKGFCFATIPERRK